MASQAPVALAPSSLVSASSLQSPGPVSSSPSLQSFSSAPVSSSPHIGCFSDSEPSQSILVPHAPYVNSNVCSDNSGNDLISDNGFFNGNNEFNSGINDFINGNMELNSEVNNESNSVINSVLNNSNESGGQLAPSLKIVGERKSGQLAPSVKLVDLGGSDPLKGQAPSLADDHEYFECGQQVHSELSECPMAREHMYDSTKRRHPSSDEDEVTIEVVEEGFAPPVDPKAKTSSKKLKPAPSSSCSGSSGSSSTKPAGSHSLPVKAISEKPPHRPR